MQAAQWLNQIASVDGERVAQLNPPKNKRQFLPKCCTSCGFAVPTKDDGSEGMEGLDAKRCRRDGEWLVERKYK